MMEEEVEESDSDDEIQKNLARKRNPQPISASPDVWKDDSGILNLSYPGPCLPHPQVSWSRHCIFGFVNRIISFPSGFPPCKHGPATGRPRKSRQS